jgi:UrcA family protein
MFTKITLFVAAVALASPLAAKAQHAPQIAVSYADLDLTTPGGQAALNSRIERAVRNLCPADPGLAELSRHGIATKCFSDTRIRVSQRVADAVSASRMTRNAGQQVAAR